MDTAGMSDPRRETATGVPRRTAMAGAGIVALAAGTAACAGAGEAPGSGTVLGKASEVQVGGGKVFKDAETVVTQPKNGEFQGFSAICTHQGCVVDNVGGGTINCKCHGSKFQLDGKVANGPAQKPLPERAVTVNDKGELVIG